MGFLRVGRYRLPVWVLFVLIVAGCSSTNHKAPVETRSTPARSSAPPPVVASPAAPAPGTEAPPKPLPGAENAGKPGYYTVKPGDTVLRIALDTGQNWRDLVRWNGLDNPNLVEVGQVLRVVPPGVDPAAVSARAVPGAGRVETRPLDAVPAPPAVAPPASATASAAAAVPASTASASPPNAAAIAAAPVASAAPAPSGTAPPVRDSTEELVWIWPASGALIAGFDEGRNKGLIIAGKAGDPVLAASDGRVVYAGSSLRGYGNLVIVKHSEVYLTAYAHNQTLLVKDDQVVRRGQKIAEMGSSDAERVQLHFEIRRQGKPIDPAKLLPPR